MQCANNRSTCKLLAVDGFAAGAVSLGKVTALEHEVGNDTVKSGALVAETILARSELTEVSGGLGNDVVIQLEHDPLCSLVADRDLKLSIVSGSRTGKEEEETHIDVCHGCWFFFFFGNLCDGDNSPTPLGGKEGL